MGNKRLLAVGLGLVIGLAGLGVAFAQSPVPGATGPTGTHSGQRIAAKLAKASGQTVVQVEALKAKDGTWRTVVKDLGLTPAQIWGQTTQLPTPAN